MLVMLQNGEVHLEGDKNTKHPETGRHQRKTAALAAGESVLCGRGKEREEKTIQFNGR